MVLEGETNKAIIIEDNSSPLARSHTRSEATSSSLSTTERSSKTRQHTSLFSRSQSRGNGMEILKERAHCYVGFTHAAATIDIVLAHDAVAVVNALAALESAQITHSRSSKVDWIVGIQDIDATVGEILGVTIGGEDLDSVVNSRGGDSGFVRMT
jgi:hypothetical protein